MKKLIGFIFALTMAPLTVVAQSGVSASYIRMTPTVLPTACRQGDLRVDSSSFALQMCNGSNTWTAFASGSVASSIGNLDAQSVNSKGLALVSNVLSAQSADGTHPGMVNTTSQTFAGQKTFSTGISGALTGNASTATALASIPTGCTSNQFATSIGASGNLGCTQPAFSNLSGSVASTQMPALTGDITTSAGAVATTLATVNSNVGSFGSTTTIPVVTVNAKGQVTAASSVSLSVTGVVPTKQIFTSTSFTGWKFTVSSANATVGATYTNNGHTFTVLSTIASSTTLYVSGATTLSGGSGTLTKATGTGDSTISFSASFITGTYTLPTSPRTPLYIQVRMVGPGGGGQGGGTGATLGGNGQVPTTFGIGLLSAGVGFAPTLGNNSGAPGTASLGSGPTGIALTGGYGQAVGATSQGFGGNGGVTAFGGAGQGGAPGAAGQAGSANTGAGGGGGATSVGTAGGAGGGSGGYVDAIIASPSATYTYVVGIGGVGGTGGTSGTAGADGSAGYIEVTELY